MKITLFQLTLPLKRLLSYFPTRLPVGMTEFNAWASSIIDLTGKFADDTSLRFVLASELMHSDAKRGSVPKNYFVSRCRKLAANQTAGFILQEIKAAQEAEKAKQAVEVTPAQSAGTSSEKALS